jgi:hypothetical protein
MLVLSHLAAFRLAFVGDISTIAPMALLGQAVSSHLAALPRQKRSGISRQIGFISHILVGNEQERHGTQI